MTAEGSYNRTAKSLKNGLVAIVIQVVSLLIGFWSRKIFLDWLGTEILGLNTTAASLLNFLNLAELGISSAIAVTLYKPLFDSDHRSVREIVALQGWLYRRVALIIIAASIVLIPFFPKIFTKMELPIWYAYASFGVLLFSALLGYFVNYKQSVLAADQKDYKIQISYRLTMIVKVAAQMVAVRFFSHPYVWWLVFEAVFAIIAAIALNVAVSRNYPYMKDECPVDRDLRSRYPYVLTKIKQLFVHKIGIFVTLQAMPLFIYAFTSLTEVALYGNYLILSNSLQSVLVAIFTSITASVGNMIAEGDRNLIFKVFRELFAVRFLMVGLGCFGLYFLTEPFITYWIGEGYVLNHTTLVLVVILFFMNNLRSVVDTYINAYGLFRDIWAPVAEAAIFAVAAVVLGRLYGLNGVLAAAILELALIIYIWRPYFLFHSGMGRNAATYFGLFLKLMLCLAAAFVLSAFVIRNIGIDPTAGLLQFVMYAVIGCGVFTLLMFGILYVAEPGMRTFVTRMGRLMATK